MSTGKLTDAKVRIAKPAEKPYRARLRPGFLCIRVFGVTRYRESISTCRRDISAWMVSML